MIRARVLPPHSSEATPRSLAALNATAPGQWLRPDDLSPSAKWAPLLAGPVPQTPEGWVPLSALATVRRGIATGCNAFFMLARSDLARLGITEACRVPCVARARQVQGTQFTRADWEALYASDAPVTLLSFAEPLSAPDRAYIAHGAANGLPHRYLLSRRTPWYAMERRPVAPIWGAVFGRAGLRFVWNDAGVQCLTAFHGIRPTCGDREMARALCTVLNSAPMRPHLTRVGRRYGGGLLKVEPGDLAALTVPDLRRCPRPLIRALSRSLDAPDASARLLDELLAAVANA